MKVPVRRIDGIRITASKAKDVEIVGHGTDLADDDSFAEMRFYANGGKTVVTVKGPGKDMRQLARSFADMLKRERKANTL